MIKYLGSKRLLATMLGDIAVAVGARTAVDVFTGTTRVAQEFKRRGIHVTALDCATYAEVLAQCYVVTDAASVDKDELSGALALLNALPGKAGYFTETFCVASRYFQPKNGMRVDAIRDAIESSYRTSALYPMLLTALMLAADRVDSTTGVQMAYLKSWAPRALNDLELRMPELLVGDGAAMRGDASTLIDVVPAVDLAYLDPPYNQHRYFTNYHVWETLMRWDAPEHYGIACKRIDSHDDSTHSPFNSKPAMPAALQSLIARTKAKVVIVSYNDESWVRPDDITAWLRAAGHDEVALLEVDSKRYVGAQIGIHNPAGRKVGTVSHLRNTEYVFVAGSRAAVAEATGFVLAPTA